MTCKLPLFKKHILTVCLVLLGARMSAQVSRMYTLQDGLPTSDIYDIFVDSHGWAWVSGMSSVCLFDGSNFYNLLDQNGSSDNSPKINTVRGVREGSNGLYWMYTSNGLYCYEHSRNKFTHVLLSNDEDSVKGVSIQLLTDYPKTDYMLISTDENGILVFNSAKQEVDTMLTKRLMKVMPESMYSEAYIDTDQRLWAMGHTLHCVDLKTMKTMEPAMTDEARAVLRNHRVEDILQLRKSGNILLATNGGIVVYDRALKTIRTLHGGHISMPVSVLKETKDGRVLVGFDNNGIWTMNPDETLSQFNIYMPNVNLQFAKVHTIAEDADGNLLIGMLQKGVMVISRSHENFKYYAISPTANKNNAVCVTSITYDKRTGYIIATDGCGVFRSSTADFSQAQQISDGLRSMLTLDVLIDREGTVWTGSYGGGVQCAPLTTQGETPKFTTPQYLQSISNGLIMSLAYDAKRNILYAGSNGQGVHVINLTTHSVSNLLMRRFFNGWISALYCDADGNLYIGTGEGIFVYHPKTDMIDELKFEKSNIVTIQCFDKQGDTLLVATNMGLVLYDLDSKKYTRLLQNEHIKALEVSGNDISVTTLKEIICIDKVTNHIRRYDSFGSYFIGEFHVCAHYKSPEGEIFFGGDNGIISFDADEMKEKKTLQNNLVFTRLLVNGREQRYNPDSKHNVMDADIQSATRINLASNERTIRLTCSVPNFLAPNRVQYQYKLDGYDPEWRSMGSWNEVYYPNLPSGTYTLRIKACYKNNEDETLEHSIVISIAQPWYNTIWAWLVYIILISVVIYFVRKVLHDRSRQRNLLTMARHNEQLKEAKLRMFTSIAHELRSPLTMILSPLRQLKSLTEDEEVLGVYDVMQRNCERMLNVVQQITDIRRIDNGQFHLHFSEINFAHYSDYICSSFTAFSSAKQITFTIEHLNQNINLWIDTIHFEKILTNILSNAFKFTPKGGRIILRTKCILKESKDWFEIRIYNSGPQISAKDIPHIFERFYQAEGVSQNAGSGIGLNLVNELVHLHHGTIEVHNIDPDGVEFVMQFPLGNAHLTEQELLPREVIADSNEKKEDLFAEIEPYDTGNDEENRKNRYTLLIVDDDKDLCLYIKGQLQEDYSIVVANSGNAAWNEILRVRPDLVVTDIRMPDGNGIELCKRIKGNPETDNIPIIMLTSENSDRAQINSLNLQVDHFLAKPFNLLMLKGAIAHSLRIREQMKSRIRRTEVGYEYSQMTIDSMDDQLFERVNTVLKENLDDSTFGVSELAEQVGISRVHLNRKMKERYGMSPVNFIRSYRLKQAAYFLANSNVNVSEVAYRVGFSSHSHFSNSFRDFFGMTPKEFITYYSGNEDDETLQKLLE